MLDKEKPSPIWSTKDIAKAAGVHPNTVRLYEAWGYLPPIPRTANGYRRYTKEHLEQMTLARIALPGPYPGDGRPVYDLVRAAANARLETAFELANRYLENVKRERVAAEEAVKVLQSWADNQSLDKDAPLFFRSEAA